MPSAKAFLLETSHKVLASLCVPGVTLTLLRRSWVAPSGSTAQALSSPLDLQPSDGSNPQRDAHNNIPTSFFMQLLTAA